ncbi:hypothetical protein [Methyloligella solikamskensis]|uniref:Uncharacterized protein n=1 Tax=Methyloligella solikamskensis TaxID=1177756 RepID=A0ABW3JAR4_9HYPH
MFRVLVSMALLILSLYAVFAAWAETSRALVTQQQTAGAAAPAYGLWLLAVIAVPLTFSLIGSMVYSVPAMIADWYEDNRAWLTTLGLGAFVLLVFYWL